MGLLSGMMDSVINMMGPASGTSSSPSLSASTSVGTSLEVRGIAQAKAKRALSPRSFILPNRRKKTKQGGTRAKSLFRVFNERLEEEDKKGLIAPIPESQFISTFDLPTNEERYGRDHEFRGRGQRQKLSLSSNPATSERTPEKYRSR
ncbi:hypothetical protein OIU78_014730 [Salix suchowensis]|nr:hypothetical protein OIU78_014730 [Salix suchowensis]